MTDNIIHPQTPPTTSSSTKPLEPEDHVTTPELIPTDDAQKIEEYPPEDDIKLPEQLSKDIDIEFMDQRDSTCFFGSAKFSTFQLSTRDLFSDGSQKYFVVAFEKLESGSKAYAYSDETSELKVIPVLDIKEKLEGRASLASFVKARNQFQSKIHLVPTSVSDETKDKPIDSKETHQEFIKEEPVKVKKFKKEAAEEEQKKVKKHKKEASENRRRSTRLASVALEEKNIQIKKRKTESEANRKQEQKLGREKKKLETQKKIDDRQQRAEARTKAKIEEDPMNQDKPTLPSDTIKPRQSQDQFSVTPFLDPPSPAEPSKDSKPTPVENAPTIQRNDMLVLNQTVGPSGYISLQWHEQQMAKIREAYFRNTILNLQTNEMLLLTSQKPYN